MKKFWGVFLVLFFSILGYSQTTTITIIASTDTHGYITSYDFVNEKDLNYGLPYAAKVIKKLKEENKNVILVDCGDTISGAPLTYYHAYFEADSPNPVIKAMNKMEYELAVLGNHDFDFGVDYLKKAIKQSKFLWISANVYKGNVPFVKSYQIIEKDGVKVGFFGLTTPATKYFEPPKNYKELVFKKMAESAKKAVASLKKQGADVIVALVHSGKGPIYSEKEPLENGLRYVLENVKGIDVAIYGHTHKENPIEFYNNVLICQPKNYYQSVAVVLIDLQKRDGKWEILNRASTVIKVGEKEDNSYNKLVKYITSDMEDFLSQKIGKYKDRIELKQDYTDPGNGFNLLYNIEKSVFNNADAYLLTLPFDSAVKKKGRVLRVRHVFKLLPYDNYLVKCKIKGKNLLKLLENGVDLMSDEKTLVKDAKPYYVDMAKNVDYKVNFKAPLGKRIIISKVNGNNFDLNKDYTVVLTAYRYTENLQLFESESATYSDKSFRSAALDYLKNKYGEKEDKKKNNSWF